MPEQPDLAELIESVREYIATEVVGATSDPRQRFRALVAANVLAISEREVRAGAPAEPFDEEQLAADVRSGRVRVVPGDESWEQVRESLIDRLRLSNPGFLKQTGYDRRPGEE